MLKRNLKPLIETAFVIILSLPLVLYAWIGFYSRYVADDFWTAGYLRVLGFWEAQHYWYFSWSGRYSFTFLVSLMELLGVGATRWLPISSLVLWTVALYWFWDNIFKLAGLPYSRWIRLSASLLVIYTTLRISVGWQQAFLWQTGLLTYTVPLIGLTFWTAWFLARFSRQEVETPRRHILLWTALLFWFLGGFSETSLAFQTVLLGLALVLFVILSRKTPNFHGSLVLLAAALVGSLAALLCVLIAPGNFIRLGQDGGIRLPQLTELIGQTIQFAQHYFKTLFTLSIRPMLCILGIPALFAIGFHPRLNQGPTRRDLLLPIGFLLLFLLVILGVYWVCFLPAYGAMRTGPPLRSIIVMFFWLSLTLVIESYVFGLIICRLAQRISSFFQRVERSIRVCTTLAIFALLVLGPLQSAQKLWQVIPEYQQFAAEWDARDQLARQNAANGIPNAVLPQLNDLYGLGPEAGRQFARYYGLLGTITFEAPRP